MKKGLELKFGELSFVFDKVTIKTSSYIESAPEKGWVQRDIIKYNIQTEDGRKLDLSESNIPRKGLYDGDSILLVYSGIKCKALIGPLAKGRDLYAHVFK